MKTLSILLTGILLTVSNTCNGVKEQVEQAMEGEKPKNIVCLVDFSSSIPEATTEWYGATIKNELLPNLGNEDRLTMLPIDYGSQTASSELYYMDLKEHDFSNQYDSKLKKAEIEQKRFLDFLEAQGYAEFESAFSAAKEQRSSYNKGTDIIGALNQALDYHSDAYENYIIILSDMIQETEQLNLEKTYRNKGNLLDLTDIDEGNLEGYSAVLLTGEQPTISIEKYQAIQGFWEMYLPNVGCRLIDYNSGGLNALRNLMESN